MTTFRLPKPYTADELERLYAAADDPCVHASMRFLHATGLRSAEALSVETGLARSWPEPGRFRRRSTTFRVVGKGDKERVVLLNNDALRAARDLLPYANGHLIPWADRTLRVKIQRVGELAGVHAHPHRFRHTYVTELVEAGNPIEVVADMAGHSRVDITRLYYSASVTARVEAERRRRRWRRRG